MPYFMAIATDLDGTLTTHGRLDPHAMAALDNARGRIATILVTGRIRSEMLEDFPELETHFDAAVYENGAVVRVGGTPVAHTTGVHHGLVDELTRSGVQLRHGEAILACRAADATRIGEAVAELGLDEQLIHNRSELMVVPAGCSKGTGLLTALRELGVSAHNTAAIGDAENDLSMLDIAEVGACVADAVSSVRYQADVCLGVGGGGVRELVEHMLADDLPMPARHEQHIGTAADGSPVTVPGARARIMVSGESGAGKSYMAGLLVERWIVDGYKVLVLDPEGEHSALGVYHQAIVIDSSARPSTEEVAAAIRDPVRSVIVDLSASSPADKAAYVADVLRIAADCYERYALPHWTVIDEAHEYASAHTAFSLESVPDGRGICYVSYHPEQLCDAVTSTMDVTLTAASRPHGSQDAADATYLGTEGWPRDFRLDRRRTAHTRHRRKYMMSALPSRDWFTFRASDGTPVSTARSLEEFVAQFRSAHTGSIHHHAANSDFSAWAAGSIRDATLSTQLAAVEHDYSTATDAAAERARDEICHALAERYAGRAATPAPALTAE